MSDAKASAEAAINRYFRLLNNPDSLLDSEAIAKAAKRIEEAETPVARILARQEHADLQVPDVDGITATFVEHVKQWADDNSVDAAILLHEGVPADVLKQAGMDTQVKAAERIAAPAPERRKSRSRVKADEIHSWLARRRSPDAITVRDVVAGTGASSAVVRRVVNEVVEEGLYVEAGLLQDEGPGRAPMTYRRA